MKKQIPTLMFVITVIFFILISGFMGFIICSNQQDKKDIDEARKEYEKSWEKLHSSDTRSPLIFDGKQEKQTWCSANTKQTMTYEEYIMCNNL